MVPRGARAGSRPPVQAPRRRSSGPRRWSAGEPGSNVQEGRERSSPGAPVGRPRRSQASDLRFGTPERARHVPSGPPGGAGTGPSGRSPEAQTGRSVALEPHRLADRTGLRTPPVGDGLTRRSPRPPSAAGSAARVRRTGPAWPSVTSTRSPSGRLRISTAHRRSGTCRTTFATSSVRASSASSASSRSPQRVRKRRRMRRMCRAECSLTVKSIRYVPPSPAGGSSVA